MSDQHDEQALQAYMELDLERLRRLRGEALAVFIAAVDDDQRRAEASARFDRVQWLLHQGLKGRTHDLLREVSTGDTTEPVEDDEVFELDLAALDERYERAWNLLAEKRKEGPRALADADALAADLIKKWPPNLYAWPTLGWKPLEGGTGTGGIGVRVARTPLRAMGYRVGVGGLHDPERQRILRRCFAGPLPFVESVDYMMGWGPAGSPARLQRVANALVQNIRAFEANDPEKFEVAISEWRDDLAWLEEQLFDPEFGFEMPFAP